MGAFVTVRWVISFFIVVFWGHNNSDEMEGSGFLFHILLCLHMLFSKVCIIPEPRTPALHLQKIILYF